MSLALWQEFGDVFARLASNTDVRVAIVGAQGKMFTAGLGKFALSRLIYVDKSCHQLIHLLFIVFTFL